MRASDGAWRTFLRALRSAPAGLTVAAIWLLAAAVLIMQFWIDFNAFGEPFEVVDGRSVLLALLGMALPGAVFTLQKWQQSAAGEETAATSRTTCAHASPSSMLARRTARRCASAGAGRRR